MREIKFRAWDSMFKMKDVAGIDFKKRVVELLNEQGESFEVNLNRLNLMQSTELFDKNGKEIYEGDVIKVTGEFAIDDSGIIKWSQQEDDYTYHCGFMVDWQEEVKRRSHLSFWANHREIEIIGNIYENPELLEEQK